MEAVRGWVWIFSGIAHSPCHGITLTHHTSMVAFFASLPSLKPRTRGRLNCVLTKQKEALLKMNVSFKTERLRLNALLQITAPC